MRESDPQNMVRICCVGSFLKSQRLLAIRILDERTNRFRSVLILAHDLQLITWQVVESYCKRYSGLCSLERFLVLLLSSLQRSDEMKFNCNREYFDQNRNDKETPFLAGMIRRKLRKILRL